MEFYDVNFSYIDNETFEEKYVAVPEQGGGKLIPDGICNPGQVYTVSRGKSGMIGLFRLESQMLPGNGKFERTGLGADRDAKEATNTAFNFLKANSNRISGSISTTTKDYNASRLRRKRTEDKKHRNAERSCAFCIHTVCGQKKCEINDLSERLR